MVQVHRGGIGKLALVATNHFKQQFCYASLQTLDPNKPRASTLEMRLQQLRPTSVINSQIDELRVQRVRVVSVVEFCLPAAVLDSSVFVCVYMCLHIMYCSSSKPRLNHIKLASSASRTYLLVCCAAELPRS